MGTQTGRAGGIGCRLKVNPPNCKRTTRAMVCDAANVAKVLIHRESGETQWFYFKPDVHKWLTLGASNFLAWNRLMNWNIEHPYWSQENKSPSP